MNDGQLLRDEEDPLINKNDDEEEEPGPGMMFHIGVFILDCIKTVWRLLKTIILCICNCLGHCWYPCKERAADCCLGCNHCLNPESDPSYSGF